jgi:lysophospholipase L1-like esterase
MGTHRRWLGIAALTIALAAFGTAMQTNIASAESNGGVRVMPLGDSITDGAQVPGGYRIGLWQRTTAGGYQADFAGSQFNGPASLGDHDHEGHPGWRIDQIDANITGWLGTYTPHTILLHIGTNDVVQNFNLSSAPDRLSTLLGHITAAAPSAEVFVATIIPMGNSGQESAVVTYNAAIPGIVQSKINSGKHVHLVDIHSALTSADLLDGTHPTADGYDKMAAVWYRALQSVPGSIGTPSGPSSTLVSAASGRCLDVPGSNGTNGTQTIIWDCNGGTNQRWTRNGQTLQSLGTCLDVPWNATAGSRVQIWDCNGGSNQQWNLNTNGTISSVLTGLCLDVSGGNTTNATPVILWSCSAAANQRWSRV